MWEDTCPICGKSFGMPDTFRKHVETCRARKTKIQIVNNELEGLAAVPRTHPVTCANPAPWYITEMKIESGHAFNDEPCSKVVYIRGEGSMWFRLSSCMVGDYAELKEYVEYKTEQENIERAVSTYEKVI